MNSAIALPVSPSPLFAPFGRSDCLILASRYHAGDPVVRRAAETYTPERFLRLFLTAHGMKPEGIWKSHTYVRLKDSESGLDHFFLIPLPYRPNPRAANARERANDPRPEIRIRDGVLWVDGIPTEARPQSIPFTTPFWYFHYDPNREATPFHSMTLNLKPACPEKCTLCAGAKTGRVNNGTDGALETDRSFARILKQHPEAAEQLDSVAVVTGCFDTFDSLTSHLREVRDAARKYANPPVLRVLEHNVTTPEQYAIVVGELGYDVFITLECFDQSMRKLALNGNVGRKGRNSEEFVAMMKTYATYLEAHPELNRDLVRVTYLMGIDSLEVTDRLFKEMADFNRGLKRAKIIPWLSIFTPYDESMRIIQRPDFSLRLLIESQQLAEKYFGAETMARESGSTAEGYARGLF
jgi:hypothetical protein